MIREQKRALIAMSGGVDSGVAALLTQREGYECIGATMKLYRKEQPDACGGKTCCSLDDVEDARAVAAKLNIPHYVFNFSDRFEQDVIRRFVDAYENGRTPNPCIDCNRFLKFDALFRRAQELGCDCIVTGHYARVEYCEASGRCLLRKAADPAKDQSYVLWSLRQEQLAKTLFPLGGLSKPEVRQIAQENGFVNAQKHDSQDICFVPNGKYAEFVEEYTGKSYPEGDFITGDGRVIGKHKGVIRYTVGQKKGLGLVLPEPMYVCAIDPEANTVRLGSSEELFSTELTAGEINLISLPRIERPMRLKAKVRYRQQEEWATVSQPDEHTQRVVFDRPQPAITKGQSVVIYDGDIVVGGGVIV